MIDLFVSDEPLNARPKEPETMRPEDFYEAGTTSTDLIELHMAQCAANQEWADKVFMASATNVEIEREAFYLEWATKKKPPFVYYLRAGPFVKIGTAKNALSRKLSLQTGLPVEPVIVGLMMGGTKVEQDQHGMFWTSRIRGEWFVWSEPIRKHLYLRHCRYFSKALAWKYE